MKLKSGFSAKLRGLSKGQTLTEYSIVLLLVGIAAFGAYTGLGLAAKVVAGNILNFIETAVATL